MPYIVPVQPLTSRRLRGMRGLRGLGQSPYSPPPPFPGPPQAAPPGLPPGWDTGYPTVATPPVAIFAPSAASPLASIPSAVPASGMAVGTILTYQAQVYFTATSIFVPSRTIGSMTADVGAALQKKWGITLISSKLPPVSLAIFGATLSVTFTVQLNQAYGQPLDVKSIIDGEINALIGIEVMSSSIAISGNALGGAVGTPQTPSWISQNWPLLVGAGAAGLLLWKVL